MTLADNILAFYSSLHIQAKLPPEVGVMNPYQDSVTFSLCQKFYSKYYSDNAPRTLIIGINPGRFGGGVTGIPFTDPRKLEQYCGIPNDLKKKAELSADFIYKTISRFGGPDKFYARFLFSAVSPLGFTLQDKNLNYYDNNVLQEKLKPFIVACFRKQLSWNINKKICFCLGEGKNHEYLQKLNTEYAFFEKIIPLPHPRFIMQYKRKTLNEFIDLYVQNLQTKAPTSILNNRL